MSTPSWATLLKLYGRGELFHVVDVETTGLSAEHDRVIELATVTVRDGEIIDRFQTLVDPGEDVSATTTRLTGIRTDMLEGAPTPEAALRRWISYIGEGGYFVAHNAVFDWKFLKAECARAGLEFPFKRKFCTMQIAGHFFPYGGRLKLEHMVKRFGVEAPGGTHRAMADAEAAAGLFVKAVEHLLSGTSPPPPPGSIQAQPVDLSGDPWEAFKRYVKRGSMVAAAILGQASAAVADGALVISASPDHARFLEGERSRLEEAMRTVYGEGVRLRLEERAPAS